MNLMDLNSDKTEIPLRKYTWEDDSTVNRTNDGECLVLKNNGNLIVLDCGSKNNYTVLCIPGMKFVL